MDDVELGAAFDGIPVHSAMGVSMTRTAGGITINGELGELWARGQGLTQAHGGSIAILLDSATTFVIMIETGRGWATVDLRVDYLRPVALGPIEVAAEVVRAGRAIGRARAELRDRDGALCATAIATLAAEQA